MRSYGDQCEIERTSGCSSFGSIMRFVATYVSNRSSAASRTSTDGFDVSLVMRTMASVAFLSSAPKSLSERSFLRVIDEETPPPEEDKERPNFAYFSLSTCCSRRSAAGKTRTYSRWSPWTNTLSITAWTSAAAATGTIVSEYPNAPSSSNATQRIFVPPPFSPL
eukprot:31227-Pelagococcus_subviridis.AAC.4